MAKPEWMATDDERFAAQRELGLYHAYFDAFDRVVARLLTNEGPSSLLDAMAALADVTRASVVGLYLNAADGGAARMNSVWRDPHTRLAAITPEPLKLLEYASYPLLADTLAVGMVLNKSLLELPLAEQMLLAQIGARRILCIPLLNRGELFGFLCFLDDDERRERSQTELKLLAMLGNHVAQALTRLQVEEAMLANQQRLRALVGATEDMVFEIAPNGVIGQVWSGHPALPAAETLSGRQMALVLPQEMAQPLARAVPDALAGGRSLSVQCALPQLGVWLHARLQPVTVGEPRVVVLVHDVTELAQDAARKKVMLDTLNLLEEAIIDMTPAGELQETTPAWAKLRALDPRNLAFDLGKQLFTWVHPEDRAGVDATFARLLNSADPASQRFRLMQENSEFLWVEARLIAQRGPDGACHGVRGVLRDVTVAHLNEQHITQLAHYDNLTKLPNRLLLDQALAHAVDRARRDNTKVALGFIDLDHFKQINDAFGHKIGDELLINLAQRLKSVLRDNDLLARWGGDEFVVVLPDLTDTARLPDIANRLRQAARQGVVLDGMEAKPTISVGFAIFPDNAESGEELLTAADHTMYHAKHAGRNNACFYSDILHLKSLGREHVAIQARLSDAIRLGSLQVFYQPIIHAKNGEVYAIEALARWQDDKSGWISPELFIPMAEKVGLIQELSEVVTHQSLCKLREWRDAGLPQKLMLNVSRSQLFAPRFVSNLVDRLAEFRLRPADVIIEITESVALTDYSRQLKHLKLLGAAGFALAIDDFGTGYSSLSQLHEMPAQILKVDVSFTQRLHTEEGRRVMQAIVQLSHGLDLQIVVEGVENLETARFLQGLGVQFLQGFHFSEPVPPGVAELWMRLGLSGKI
ncbi:EAL domain-containing protein [Chitiniphilus purpureus]|uniref:EAL domain-containing protein n=1 Tax=Chitiniphilus purpureus TaxID=2981137 RepID=A0ABY6DPL4_9NEIS|nr:EAL domain-containing protein [Chitiniphilus sp. CD1]UXY15036.1 EAL domain-containing protein [Chitiniphilus sp. CD1]